MVADYTHQEKVVMENKQAIQKDLPQMKTDIEVIKERQLQTNQKVQDMDKKLEGVDHKVNQILDAVQRSPRPTN